MVENWQQHCLVALWGTPLDEWLEEGANDGPETVIWDEVQICQGGVYQIFTEVWMLVKLQT